MNIAAANFHSNIAAFKSENVIAVVLLAVHDNLSSEMNFLNERRKDVLKSLCTAAVSQFSK